MHVSLSCGWWNSSALYISLFTLSERHNAPLVTGFSLPLYRFVHAVPKSLFFNLYSFLSYNIFLQKTSSSARTQSYVQNRHQECGLRLDITTGADLLSLLLTWILSSKQFIDSVSIIGITPVWWNRACSQCNRCTKMKPARIERNLEGAGSRSRKMSYPHFGLKVIRVWVFLILQYFGR